MCSPQELRRLELRPAQQPWLSTIIDEAHELRNPFSFWGIGAMLAGAPPTPPPAPPPPPAPLRLPARPASLQTAC
jgi:hypothetical protein